MSQHRTWGVSECVSECFFSVKPKLLKPQKYFYLIFALHPGASTNFVGTDAATGQPVKYCECSVMQVVLSLKVKCATPTKILFTHAGDTRAHFILIPDDEGLVAVQKQYQAARVIPFQTVLNYKPPLQNLESPLELFRSAPSPPAHQNKAGKANTKAVNLLSYFQLPKCDLSALQFQIETRQQEPWSTFSATQRIRLAPMITF